METPTRRRAAGVSGETGRAPSARSKDQDRSPHQAWAQDRRTPRPSRAASSPRRLLPRFRSAITRRSPFAPGQQVTATVTAGAAESLWRRSGRVAVAAVVGLPVAAMAAAPAAPTAAVGGIAMEVVSPVPEELRRPPNMCRRRPCWRGGGRLPVGMGER